VFCKKPDNLKNKPTGVLQKFYAQMPTLPASDDITRFDGFFTAILSLDAFQAKPSQISSESRRKIGTCVCNSPRKFNCNVDFLETRC
jgi:hypothetical protein